MEKEEKIDDLLKEIRGKVLNETILVEGCLTRVLDYYFFKGNNNERSVVFYWEILNPLNFYEKISLFKKIPSFKKRKNYEGILNCLNVVIKLRNRLAHGRIDYNKCRIKKLVVYNPITLKRVIIDEKILEEFDNAIFYVHFHMCKNHDSEKSNLKEIL